MVQPGTVAVKIRLPYERSIFLKTEAIRRGMTIGELVDEALRGLEEFKNAGVASPKQRSR